MGTQFLDNIKRLIFFINKVPSEDFLHYYYLQINYTVKYTNPLCLPLETRDRNQVKETQNVFFIIKYRICYNINYL